MEEKQVLYIPSLSQ